MFVVAMRSSEAAIIALLRVANRYVGNLPPMPGVFPDFPAPVVRKTDHGSELTTMRWVNASSAEVRRPAGDQPTSATPRRRTGTAG